MKRSSALLPFGLGLFAAVGCDRTPGSTAPTPSPQQSSLSTASAEPSSPEPELVSPPPAASSSAERFAPAKYAPIPNWTNNGSESASGMMVLRCENAFPPEDSSGKCKCEGYELDVCADGIRSLMIDRKQCGFICKPKPQTAKKIALRCPDGTNPETSAKGCACSGRQPLDPCAGGIAAVALTAGECVVTCKKDQ